MNRKIFNEGMTKLVFAFPQSRIEMSKMMLDVWFDSFKEVEADKFIEGIQEIIDRNKFFPSISELKDASCGILKADPEADAMLAWSKVLKGIRDAGYIRSVKFDDEIIHSVIHSLGGWVRLCQLPDETELKFYRIAFLKGYQSMKRLQLENRLPMVEYLPGTTEIENQTKFPNAIEPPKRIGFTENNLPVRA